VPGNQEITRSTRSRKKVGNPPGKHPISAGIWVFLDLWCSGEAKEKKKNLIFHFLFLCSLEILGGNLVLSLLTRKLTYYYQEFTRKLPGF
jgi:hypothetical protein